MPTSGSIDFTVSRDEIITEALEQLGVLPEGGTANTDQLTSCARTLNMLVKAWQAEGLNLFALQRQYLVLSQSQEEYSLSATTSDVFSTKRPEYYTVTGSTATTIDIDAGLETAAAAGDTLKVGTTVYTLATAHSVGDTTLNLNGAVSVSVDDQVVLVGAVANRPMRIINAVSSDKDRNIIPMTMWNRKEYSEQTIKDTTGRTLQVYYDPQVAAGKLFVWPTSDKETDYLELWSQRTLEDFDSGTDNPDFPQEWYLALSFNLAALLVGKYGVPAERIMDIKRQAEIEYSRASGFDVEGSLYFEPDMRR